MASSKSKKAPHKMRPEGELTIYTASDTKNLLVEALAKHREIEIDLSQVTEIDTAGMQLLILAKKEATRNQLQVRFTDHSPAVIDAMELLDLTGFFGDPVVMPRAESSRRASS